MIEKENVNEVKKFNRIMLFVSFLISCLFILVPLIDILFFNKSFLDNIILAFLFIIPIATYIMVGFISDSFAYFCIIFEFFLSWFILYKLLKD